MGVDRQIQIEVVYASPERQYLVTLKLPAGSKANVAIAESGFLKKFPEIDLRRQKIGIYGRIVTADHVLEDGQRLEIYRQLIRDPKQARRERAARAKRISKPGR